MDVLTVLQSYWGVFYKLMKEFFFSENSRMWWAWILITFPLIGASVGVIEMRKEKRPITLKGLFEFVFPQSIYKSKSFRNDVIIVGSLYLFYAFVLLMVAGVGAESILVKMIGFINTSGMESLSLGAYKKTLAYSIGIHLFFTFIVILFYDFGFTMLHFAFHKVPFLWKFHKVHHSAEHLTPLTVARFHLVEFILQKISEGFFLGLIFGIFYFLLPEGVDIYKVFGLSIFGVLFSSIGVFRHSHIWISYGPYLSYVFCSPAMHQIHHSTEARHLDKNYSQVFSFWDYLLGSLYIPKEKETFSVGLVGEKEWNEAPLLKQAATHLSQR